MQYKKSEDVSRTSLLSS